MFDFSCLLCLILFTVSQYLLSNHFSFDKKNNLYFPFVLQNVNYYAKSWLPARSIVMECLAARETIDSSGEIIKLNRSCPVSRQAI